MLCIVKDFSDEILMKIFSFLDSEDILSTLTVHEKFQRLAFDESLWRGHRQFEKINLSSKLVPLALIEELFEHGTKYICLDGATILNKITIRNEDGSKKVVHNFGEKKENLPQYDTVKFLDLSHVRFKANSGEIPSETTNRYLSRVLVMCPSLKKLSLQGLRISNQIFTHYISAKKTLTHLNLFACSGLVWSDIQTIVVRCNGLIELNLGNCKLSPSHTWANGLKTDVNLESICANLPCNMQKLSLCNLEINDEAVQKLVNRCPNLIELDLYGHRNENLTGKSATSIIQVLSHSLVKLAIPCLAEETKPLELASMPKLQCLWMPGLSNRRRKILKKQVPHLKINESEIDDLLSKTIASPREMYLSHQGFWQLPCSVTNYNTVKSILSEVDEKWTHLGDLESS